jgi:phosphate transport system substrate-binding protein
VIDMKKLIQLFTLVALVAPAFVWAGDNDLAVVVNKSNSTSSLTKSQLRKLVLGEQASWPGGQKVIVVLANPGAPERDGVLRAVCRMSEEEYNEHVMHANFNGDAGARPLIASSPAAVRQLVASTPGAIGFLRMPDLNDSIKVASVDGANPGTADYRIKAGK